MNLCDRILLLLSLVQMFLRLLDALDSVGTTASSVERPTEESGWLAVLKRVAELLLWSSFVDLGTGTLGSSRYLSYFLMWYPSFIKMRVKHNL